MRSFPSSSGPLPTKAATAQRGLSLVELMISITLGLIVVGALSTLFVNSSSSRSKLDRSVDILENGHYALDLLKSELSLAGYYGTLAAPMGITDLPCSTAVADWAASLALPAHGSNQDESPTTLPCLGGLRKANTDAILIQRASTCVAANSAVGSFGPESGCAAPASNAAYLQVSQCNGEYTNGCGGPTPRPFVLAVSPNSAPTSFATAANAGYSLMDGSTSQATCCTTGTPGTAPMRYFYRSIYYIGNDNGLWRLDVDAGSTATPPGTAVQLAANIDNMQLEYGIDDGTAPGFVNDGSPDRFVSAPVAADWPNVVGVRVSLLVRAGNPESGYQDAKTYFLGDVCSLPSGSACPAPFAASAPITRSAADQSYKRHVFTSYVAFTNPVGRRQQ